MAETDLPLKQLLHTCIADFAAWLLQTEVQEAQPLNIELPADMLLADQVFAVTLASGENRLLHLEFQGPSSHHPVRWRVLEYMARLASLYRMNITSVVFYLGQGTGARDTGLHQLPGMDGTPTLLWQYQVIRLWQMRAEDLLALERPALLALIGQTRIDAPAVIMPEVMARLHRVPDPETRQRLLTVLMALINDEELANMAQQLLERDDWVMNNPFVRRIRAAGHEEGRTEGEKLGLQRGTLLGRRQSILDLLVLRFDPPASLYRQLDQQLETITDEGQYRVLLEALARAESAAAFWTVVQEAVSGPSTT